MKKSSLSLALLLTALCHTGVAVAGVTVAFVKPDRYLDMPFSPWEKDVVMKDLNEYLVSLGAKWLPAGQDLKIDVLDINLAGILRNQADGQQIRVLRGGADWPMIELSYTLSSSGKALRTGTDRIADMNYFQSQVRDYAKSRESLYYEKRMLQDWFREKFVAARQ